MEFGWVNSVDLSHLALGCDVWKSSWRELGLVVSLLKLADGWLSSSLVLPTSEVDLTADTGEAAELLSHLFHGHLFETESTVLFFHFAISLPFSFLFWYPDFCFDGTPDTLLQEKSVLFQYVLYHEVFIPICAQQWDYHSNMYSTKNICIPICVLRFFIFI